MLFVATLLAAVLAAAPTVTEDQIRGMKMKELKEFIAARGGECKNCFEKSELIAKALSLKNVQPPQEVVFSTEPLWDQWRDHAKTLCGPNDLPEDQCKRLGDAVENLVMRISKRFVRELSVSPHQFVKYTMSHPYKQAGEVYIKRGIRHMKAEGVKAAADVEKFLTHSFNGWLRDCAIQNINSMNDALAEEQKFMKKRRA